MRINKLLSFLSVFGFFTSLSVAQNLGSSPYSRFGLGDLADPSFSRNSGMGGSGVALYHAYQANGLNPASLAGLKLTNFEFGMIAKKTTYKNNEDKRYGTSGNLHHVSLALPLHKRYVTQFGARPFSSVRYQDEFSELVAEKDNFGPTIPYRAYNITYQGSGGLSEFFWGNAYNYKDWLMVGLKLGYVKGRSSFNFSQTEVGGNQYVTQRNRNEGYISVTPGILVTKKLSFNSHLTGIIDTLVNDSVLKKSTLRKVIVDKEDNSWYLGIGLTGSFYHILKSSEEVLYKRLVLDSQYGYVVHSADTVKNNPLGYSLPSSIRVGASLAKPNRITYSLDYFMTTWTNLTPQSKTIFRSQHIIAGGLEYIPDYKSIKLYKRIAYRAGANFNMLPYKVEDQSINQWQVNLGAGLILPKTGVALNLSLAYGQRGTVANGLIKEDFWMATLGVISNTKWFIRPKHD